MQALKSCSEPSERWAPQSLDSFKLGKPQSRPCEPGLAVLGSMGKCLEGDTKHPDVATSEKEFEQRTGVAEALASLHTRMF